jgi:hypothetical protein
MQLNGQFYALAALTPVKDSQLLTVQKAGWDPASVLDAVGRENLFFLLGIKPRLHTHYMYCAI